ncbi:MAG: DUF1302 family protein [Desulfomonilia bacterium]
MIERKIFPCLMYACAFALFVHVLPLHAAADVNIEGKVKLFSSFYGEDNDDDPFDPHEAGDYTINRGELHLGLNGYVSDNVSFTSLVYFIYEARGEYERLKDLESSTGFSSEVHRQDTYVKEASFTLIDVILEGLDLTAGRQRVRWGTSDEYNVVDNLNPVDFANLFSFDPDYFVDHLPMDGFNLEYHLPVDFDLKLQAVYFFSFKPSTLPRGFFDRSTAMLTERLEELTSSYGFSGGDVDLTLESIPDYSVSKGPVGVRLSGFVFNFDWGLSYYHGYQSLPFLTRLETDITLDSTTLKGFYEYPELDVVGLDFAGEIHSIGIWGEFGAYFPEEIEVEQVTRLLTTTDREFIELFDRPYYKYTAGFDYTFGIGDGIYWNTQYNHGFYDEFSYTSDAEHVLGLGDPGFMGTLEDYFITEVEYAFFNDTLITTLDCLLEVSDFNDFSDSTALVIKPQITYKPFDNASIEIGYVVITGRSSTKYGDFDKNDVLYTLLKAYF